MQIKNFIYTNLDKHKYLLSLFILVRINIEDSESVKIYLCTHFEESDLLSYSRIDLAHHEFRPFHLKLKNQLKN